IERRDVGTMERGEIGIRRGTTLRNCGEDAIDQLALLDDLRDRAGSARRVTTGFVFECGERRCGNRLALAKPRDPFRVAREPLAVLIARVPTGGVREVQRQVSTDP